MCFFLPDKFKVPLKVPLVTSWLSSGSRESRFDVLPSITKGKKRDNLVLSRTYMTQRNLSSSNCLEFQNFLSGSKSYRLPNTLIGLQGLKGFYANISKLC